ncbi:hypothetical protein MANES_07G083801v8 [Manihot esculenta]|uniref:Uncharacterized protein n=1 Tax=Manihot esculenta TaxID=3983 RepID=A0ACB7HJE9_MANES|nr:hypothetical protein MANES_07G083801v8 [Manihot esculenta]
MICVPEGGSMAMRDWNCHGPMLFGGCRCCFIGALFSFHSLLDSPWWMCQLRWFSFTESASICSLYGVFHRCGWRS